MGHAVEDAGRTTDDLAETLTLLRTVFASDRFASPAFLEWVYRRNPLGPAYEENIDAEGGRVAHIAGVPLRFRRGAETETFVIMYNVATAPTEQGLGHYVRLCFNLIERTRESIGGFLGVANERSVSPDVNVIKTRLVAHLPVRIVTPSARGGRDVETVSVDEALLAGPRIDEWFGDVDDVPADEWSQCWSLDMVRWRLAWPTSRYSVHVSDDLVAVTTRTLRKGVPFTVLCKLWPRKGVPGPHDPSEVVAAACRHHRTPLAVYAGWNAHVPVRGVTLKQSWLPAPLALVFLSQTERIDQEAFALDTFEFLDFDAF